MDRERRLFRAGRVVSERRGKEACNDRFVKCRSNKGRVEHCTPIGSISVTSLLCFVDVMCCSAGWKMEEPLALATIGHAMVGECKAVALGPHRRLGGRDAGVSCLSFRTSPRPLNY